MLGEATCALANFAHHVTGMKLPPILAALLAVLLAGVDARAISPPVINDPAGLDGGSGRATLSAKVNPGEGFTTVKFSYGLTTGYGTFATGSKVNATDPTGTESSASVTGLVGGQTYHLRATAANALGSASTGDASFSTAAYQPTVMHAGATSVGSTTATIRISVTGNGTADFKAYVIFGKAPDDPTTPSNAVPIGAADIRKSVSLKFGDPSDANDPMPALARDTTYFYRVVLKDPNDVTVMTLPTPPAVPGLPATSSFSFTTKNTVPVAVADSVVLSRPGPLVIRVLENDRDLDGDKFSLSAISQAPEHGTAKIRGATVTYTPGIDFSGKDSFSYMIEDGFGGKSTALVTIRSPRVAGVGLHSALVKDASGKVVGSVRLNATATGAFSGKLRIGAKSYALFGEFDADGNFRGNAISDGATIPVALSILVGDSSNSITADFGAGKWSSSVAVAELSDDRRAELAGRYTVNLPPGVAPSTSTTDTSGATTPATGDANALPQGHGWATIKLNEDGEARIKGRTGDGRKFAASAFLGGTSEGPLLTIFATPRRSTVSGELALGDSVTGALSWSSNPGKSDGFEANVTATGSRYVPPGKDRRALAREDVEAGRVTITASGGNVTGFTHELRVSENDKYQVLNPGQDAVNLKLDRKSGTFRGKFRSGEDLGDRMSFTGVLLQNQSIGRGVFYGDGLAGSVQLQPTVAATPITPTGPIQNSVDLTDEPLASDN